MATISEALTAVLDHQMAGRFQEAGDICRRVLDVAPDSANAHHLMGLLLCQTGALDAGIAALRRAVALTPNAVEPTVNLAKALLTKNEGNATRALRRARRLSPLDLEIAHHLGAEAMRGGDHRLERRCWADIATVQPDLGEPWRHLAAIAEAGNDIQTARQCRRWAAASHPEDAAARNALGALARRDGDQPRAVTHFTRALALAPANTAALSTLGNTLKDLGELDSALTVHERAVRASGEDPTMVWNMAQAALLAGRYDSGWRAYERRWWAKGFPTPRRHINLPLWQGEELGGRAILLYEEQGCGDTIQFCRYATLVAALGGTVILEVGTDLMELMTRTPGVSQVVVTGTPTPPVDFACPLGSLPMLFDTTLSTIPNHFPYVLPDPARVAPWKGRLAGSALKVGLVWAGNPDFAGDRWRSPGLAALAPLLEVTEVQFFGLQIGPGGRDLERVRTPPHFVDLAPDIHDFADTAAIMVNLDLVISSCTASAHLAGALARPVWVALAQVPDWRWLMGREDSPWYPTARLFRQTAPGDWAGVARLMTSALSKWAALSKWPAKTSAVTKEPKILKERDDD